jgi:hypothetical protein
MGNTFLIAFFKSIFIAFFEKCQNGSARHKPKSAVMFCIEGFKIEPLRLVPDGFSNRFTFICSSKLERVLKHAT